MYVIIEYLTRRARVCRSRRLHRDVIDYEKKFKNRSVPCCARGFDMHTSAVHFRHIAGLYADYRCDSICVFAKTNSCTGIRATINVAAVLLREVV